MRTARFAVMALALTVLGTWMLSLTNSVLASANPADIQLNATKAVPRQVEESTGQAVARDYAKAWQAMTAAQDQNRPDLLGSMFVGAAKEEIGQAIRDQHKSDVRVRYVDRGHKLTAIFYSQEGSALQLRDLANVEVQVLDGNSVVHSEDSTINYIVLMTPAADHWQVRMLQSVP